MKEIVKRNYHPVLIILLCSLVLLIIMQPWNLYFLNDDFEHIPNNYIIVRKNFLRPVSNFFLVWDRWLFNKTAAGYYFTTLILHTSCAVSIYYLCRKVLKHYAIQLPAYVPLLTALIFLFYPFHAEPLFWIISRVSIIAAFFTITSLYYYLRKNEQFKYLLLSWIMFLFALFTYESMWNVLFFYFLISFLNIKKQISSAKKECAHAAIFLFTFLLYILIRFTALDTITGGYTDIDNNISRITLLVTNLIKLVARNFTPPFLNTVFSIIFFSLSAIIYAAVIALFIKKNKSTGLLMIILWLGVISGVITATPLGIDTHGNESERYIYYSSFFFCFFLALAVTLFKRKWQYIITGFIILSSVTALIIYNSNYRYSSTVVKNSLGFIKKYPNYKRAYFIDVPSEYKGALIFRVCLPNAVRWIDAECKYDSITIVSKIEDASGELPYITGEKNWEELNSVKKYEAQPNVYALKDSVNKSIILNKNDIVFWFTKNGLFKVNRP